MTDTIMIKIDGELKEYLDEVLHNNGAEAYYTSNIELDLNDYIGAIKQIANDLYFYKCLSNDKLPLDNIPFKETIGLKKK